MMMTLSEDDLDPRGPKGNRFLLGPKGCSKTLSIHNHPRAKIAT